MLRRLAAACLAAGISPQLLATWLAARNLPPPHEMERRLLAALVLIVEGWRRH